MNILFIWHLVPPSNNFAQLSNRGGFVKRHSSKFFAGLVLTAALVALPVFDSTTLAQADFYKGKTIRILVGSTPGSFYDLWGRLARAVLGQTNSR
jgi:hypothetical protein